MSLFAEPPEPSDPGRLALEAGRTCDQVGRLSPARLAAELPNGDNPAPPNRAAAAFALAQHMADATADLADQPRRPLPTLPGTSAGDVLAVCAHDLGDQIAQMPDIPAASAACADAVAALIALRRAL